MPYSGFLHFDLQQWIAANLKLCMLHVKLVVGTVPSSCLNPFLNFSACKLQTHLQIVSLCIVSAVSFTSGDDRACSLKLRIEWLKIMYMANWQCQGSTLRAVGRLWRVKMSLASEFEVSLASWRPEMIAEVFQ